MVAEFRSTGTARPTALAAARGAYAALVADRTILRFLMHANCAAGEPLVGQAVRRCYAKQVDTVRQLLDDDAVRHWFGAGMLDNVVAVLAWPTSTNRGHTSSPPDDPTPGNTPRRLARRSRHTLMQPWSPEGLGSE